MNPPRVPSPRATTSPAVSVSFEYPVAGSPVETCVLNETPEVRLSNLYRQRKGQGQTQRTTGHDGSATCEGPTILEAGSPPRYRD